LIGESIGIETPIELNWGGVTDFENDSSDFVRSFLIAVTGLSVGVLPMLSIQGSSV